MSEYIAEYYGSTSGNVYTERREEITRCRDCESSEGHGTVCWNDKFTHVVEVDGESRLAPVFVEPDGFCAWSVRRGA